MPVIVGTRETEIRKIMIQPQPQQKSKTLSQKYPTQKRAGGVAQVVDHLPTNMSTEFKPQHCKKKKNIYIYIYIYIYEIRNS
jgi:hypothetical protein